MSLSTTHPIFTTCGGSPYQVVRATVQARFLSGRARVESLTRHWDNTNREGYCLLCKDLNPVLGTMEHLFLSGGCPALAEARLSMLSFFAAFMVPRPYLLPLVKACWDVNKSLSMQLLLDCSVIPIIISETQRSEFPVLKDLFYLTRACVFKIYSERDYLRQNRDYWGPFS